MIYFSNGETENQMPARRAAPAGMRQPRAPRADGDLTRRSTPRSAAKMLPLHTLATLGARAGSLLPLGRAGVSRPRAAGVAAVGAPKLGSVRSPRLRGASCPHPRHTRKRWRGRLSALP